MICYSLICSKHHTFESWFASTEAYNKLKKQNLLSCSVCGSQEVEKAIMAPNVLAKATTKVDKELPNLAPLPYEKAMTDLKTHIKKNSEDVGSNFAVVAREMYEGDTPKRNIHGRTSLSEAKALSDDGVPIIPLPWFDRKTN